MLAGQAAFFTVCALIYYIFYPVADPLFLRIWSVLIALVFVAVALFDVLFFLRSSTDDERFQLFRVVDKKQTLIFDIAAIGVIWLLLPFGAVPHRLIVTAFFVGYVPLLMISDPENVFGNSASIVLVMGSFVIYLCRLGSTEAFVLAALMTIYGLTLFYAADVFRSVVVQALRQRRVLERPNTQLSDAVQAVANERDAKTRYIAAASHDLGQPINAAALYADQAVTPITKTFGRAL